MSDPRNDDKNLWVGWGEYHWLVELFALAVHESGWKFDQILCLATSSYREAAGTQQGDLDIAQYITMYAQQPIGQRAAGRRPVVDSGVTLARAQQRLKERYPSVTVVRSAVLWYKVLLEGQARLLRPAPGDESLDPPALRGVGHAAPAQPGGLDQARQYAAPQRGGAVIDSLDEPREESISGLILSAPTGADFILRAGTQPACALSV